MALLSLIVPMYNEESVVEQFYTTVKEVLKDLPMTIEYIFVNDGSKDGTLAKLRELNEKDENVHYVSFSRNFGKEAAVFAGLKEAHGDAAVVMDGDLQHPPEAIYEMYKLWSEGVQVIEGVKSNRGKEGFMHKLMAGGFYKLISGFMGMNLNNTSDFKFLDRKVIDVLCSLKERNTFFRALSFWVGFDTATVSYEVQDRVAGTTKWSLVKLIRYACNNLISFTFAPLYSIITVGIVFFIVGLALVIDAVIDHFTGIAVDGYPTLLIFMVISTGCIMFSIGIIGVYIAKIYDEIKERPQYIVQERK